MIFKEMKKQKFLGFLEWNNKIFLSSLSKIDLNIVIIVILDFLFYFISVFLFIFWLQRIQAKMSTFVLPQDVVSISKEAAQHLVQDERAFYLLIIASLVLLAVAVIFLASILKGIIWAKTTKTKITLNLISRFLGLNLIWMSFWFLITFLISFLVERTLVRNFMIGMILLGFYFTNALYTIFMKEQKMRAIPKSIHLCIAKFHLFVLPYLLLSLLLFIIVKIAGMINFKYADFVLYSALILFMAFARYYISTLVQSISSKSKDL